MLNENAGELINFPILSAGRCLVVKFAVRNEDGTRWHREAASDVM